MMFIGKQHHPAYPSMIVDVPCNHCLRSSDRQSVGRKRTRLGSVVEEHVVQILFAAMDPDYDPLMTLLREAAALMT